MAERKGNGGRLAAALALLLTPLGCGDGTERPSLDQLAAVSPPRLAEAAPTACEVDGDCAGLEAGPCAVARCGDDGRCALAPRADGTPCDDGDACTLGDTCAAGACAGGAPPACGASAPCAVAACDPAVGCVEAPAPDGTACSDGNPCTTGEACAGGACTGGEATCACEDDLDCRPFDPDLCDGALVCADGACVPGGPTPAACPAPADPCRVAACDPATGACATAPAPDGAPCPAGAACGVAATCQGGACVVPEGACDDGNPCTQDLCDAVKGCGNPPVPGAPACDDGDPCTAGDVCGGGVCAGVPEGCDCATDADCAGPAFDPCLGTWTCEGGQCAHVAGSEVDCSGLADPPCVLAACVEGACVAEAAPPGTPCDDEDACTASSTCADGACAGQGGCDDGNPCTNDVCEAATGCKHVPNALPCDDGNACTKGDTCAQGACSGGSAVACPGGGPCAEAVCDPVKGCGLAPLPDGEACDDGDPCTVGDACLVGACVGEAACACTTAEDCLPGANPCKGEPACVDGQCTVVPGTAVTCPAGSDCAPTACDPATGACVANAAPDGKACFDAGPCKQAGTCQGGACDAPDVACDDGNPCTQDACDPATGKCTAKPLDGAPCDDGNPCTVGDACSGGACKGTTGLACDDGDACTLDACKAGVGCVVTGPVVCDDGNACTTDTCAPDAGCVFTASVCPEPAEPCLVAACDAATGSCALSPAPAGTPCDDEDACTAGDACDAQGGCGGEAIACDDGDACTSDACAGGACVSTPIPGCVPDPCTDLAPGTPCDDQDDATTADLCLGGVCRGFQRQGATGGVLAAIPHSYRRVDHAHGAWHVAVQGEGGLSDLLPGGHALARLPDDGPNALIHYETTSSNPWVALRGGLAAHAGGVVREHLAGDDTWSAGTPLAEAATDTFDGRPYALWTSREAGASGAFSFWLVGETPDGGAPRVLRCDGPAPASGGANPCEEEPVESQVFPGGEPPARAVAGFPTCAQDASACASPALVLGADYQEGQSSFFNDAYERVPFSASWLEAFLDEGESASRTRDAAALGGGRFLLVGTAGYLRTRAADGEWSQNLLLKDGQTSRQMEGAWAGAGVVAVAAWRQLSANTRMAELWTLPLSGAAATSGASWQVHSLGTVSGSASGVYDVWGLEDGTLRVVGADTVSFGSVRGLVFVRQAP